jgi:hypothetical protein
MESINPDILSENRSDIHTNCLRRYTELRARYGLKDYEYHQPIARILDEFSGHWPPLSVGTVTDGFQR